MAKIILSGHLAEKFGANWDLEVASVGEAIQALDANTEDFKQALLRKDILGYHVFLDDNDIDAEHIHDPLGGRTVRIVPVIKGSGKNILGAIIVIIIAIVLIVVSWGTGTGASASMLTAYFGSTAVAAAVSSAVASLALSLLISGVTSLLSPQKKKDGASNEPEKNTPSSTFSGAVNTTAQGHPVPLGYGRLIIGSAAISAGLYSDQVASGTVVDGTGSGGVVTEDGTDVANPVVESGDGSGDGLGVGRPIAGKGIDSNDGLIVPFIEFGGA